MTQYITKNRLEEIKEELKELEGPKRKEIAQRIEDAIALGDLSENAEYHEAREEQAFNEGKIQELQQVIRNAKIIKESDHSKTKSVVEVGDQVEVEKDGERIIYTIVGSTEADPAERKISNESPIGKMLLGRSPKEEVEVPTPTNGTITYKIVRIT